MGKRTELDECVRRVQRGDVEAFEVIVRDHQAEIRGWIVSRCPPLGDADEVAQRTFVEAFRRIGDYDPGTNLRAWLFTIARYQLMAECTRVERLADYHSRYVPYALSRELERRVTDATVDEPERLTFLQECLTGVESKARSLLDWRYRDELPLAEIAARTERSVGAIKKHLFALRQKLHDCIQRKLAEEAAS